MAKRRFLLAPGAGAPSSHSRMLDFARLLGSFGEVRAFDYPYMLGGRKRPDPLPRLIEAHRAALADFGGGRSIILAGKSMGGRVGCHLALETPVEGLICFGYPLCGGGDPAKLRDEVLIATTAPILFVQGDRDKLCPLDMLEKVRKRMKARSWLHVVEGGDHSLVVGKTALKARGATQESVDAEIGEAISLFLREAKGGER